MYERFMPAGACLLLDDSLAVVHATPAARRLLQQSPPTLVVQQRHLHAIDYAVALNNALASAARGVPAAIALRRPARLPLTLRAEAWTAAGRDGVLVTLRDPELEAPDPELLQALFDLTPTEALVAAGLAQGMDSTELAHDMGVQANTVQSHVKRVLLKSGTHRQSQLVSLILRSAAMPDHPRFMGEQPADVPGLAQTGNDTFACTEYILSKQRAGSCRCL